MLRDRFSRPLDRAALALSDSTREDAELLAVDLWGSRVHARMLGETGILPVASARRIDAGLRALERRAAAGKFRLSPELEDVHLNVEEELTRRIGRDGERLHTGRSRNDQVATDLLLWLREALLDLEEGTARVAESLHRLAAGPQGRRVVAGWTHLQPAQRVYVAQILATHALRFLRDAERFRSIRERLTDSPLGSGALAGSSLPLDRRRTAELLGFSRPSVSSLDAVSDRDPVLETLAALALLSVHVSSLAEELVLGSMPQVGRVRLADAFVTTSSLMPHKRNPDLAELLRAESGPALGRLVAHLTLLKGLPLAYNRDLQTGKPILFDGVERARRALEVLAPMLATAEFLTPIEPGADTSSVELVDALVRAGVPFRAAHARLARVLARLEGDGRTLRDLGPAEWRRELPELAHGSMPAPESEPELRQTEGGSARTSVRPLLAEVGRRSRRALAVSRAERARLRALRSRLDRPIAIRSGAQRAARRKPPRRR
ncbi:MAG TPA: argininosuccinate lyase [Thermoplasmata archaeon]|nr:argininosuccinate lyase [Thermoplasmata archaeon]